MNLAIHKVLPNLLLERTHYQCLDIKRDLNLTISFYKFFIYIKVFFDAEHL
jgi:hypothetical protein